MNCFQFCYNFALNLNSRRYTDESLTILHQICFQFQLAPLLREFDVRSLKDVDLCNMFHAHLMHTELVGRDVRGRA